MAEYAETGPEIRDAISEIHRKKIEKTALALTLFMVGLLALLGLTYLMYSEAPNESGLQSSTASTSAWTSVPG